MKTIFIVISHPRSGSTYFCNRILSSNPDFFCYDALFSQKNPNTIEYLNRLGLDFYDDNDIDQYLEEHYCRAARYTGKNIIGFKIFIGHLTDIDYKQILDNKNYKIILLHRKAIIKSAVSYQIAKRTGQWDHRDKKISIHLTLTLINVLTG